MAAIWSICHIFVTILLSHLLPAMFTWPVRSILASSLSNGPSLSPPRIGSRALPSNVHLKLLCVGDSITVGLEDGHPNLQGLNNGYRLDLYNMLTAKDIDVQFIGTQVSGTDNPQPDMEGYGWQTINTILNKIREDDIVDQQPNLVLIHAGTNDMNLPQNSDDPAILYSDAPTRLGNLIDYILSIDPDTVILVAKLIQNTYHPEQTEDFNAAVPDVVAERYEKGYKVRMVDMSMIGGDELADALHPVAKGYLDMANRWFDAILDIPDFWWTAFSTLQEQQADEGPLKSFANQRATPFPHAIGVAFLWLLIFTSGVMTSHVMSAPKGEAEMALKG